MDLGEPVEMLLVETAQIRLPQQIDVGLGALGRGMPEPDRLGLRLTRQPLDIDPDQGSGQDRQRPPGRETAPRPVAGQGLVQTVPRAHPHPPIPLGVRGDLHIGLGMRGRVRAHEPGPVPRRAPHTPVRRKSRTVEHPIPAHPPHHLNRTAGHGVREIHDRVTGVEHHQRRHLPRPKPTGDRQIIEQALDLRERRRTGTAPGLDTSRLERVDPGTRAPGKPRQDTDRPPGHQPVPAGPAHPRHREPVYVPGVRTRDRGHIHAEHQRLTLPRRRQPIHQHPPQPPHIHPSMRQRLVHHRVPTPELRLQRELHRAGHRPGRTRHRVTQVEQRIRPPRETPVYIRTQPPQPVTPRPIGPTARLDHALRAWQDQAHAATCPLRFLR